MKKKNSFEISALAIFSLLPENAFCSLKGTCYGGKPHYQQRYENYVDKYSTNAHLAAQYRLVKKRNHFCNLTEKLVFRRKRK